MMTTTMMTTVVPLMMMTAANSARHAAESTDVNATASVAHDAAQAASSGDPAGILIGVVLAAVVVFGLIVAATR